MAASIDRSAGDRSEVSEAPVHAPMGTAEFAVATGCLMALTALATDVMLAVLPDIARALDVVDGNSRQLVVVVFLVGFGVGQLIVGSVSDGFGRKPVLLVGLIAYVAFGALSAAATDFQMLLAARLMQGLAAAVPRVVCLSIVRDCYSGTRMARVLSLASMILIVVPIVAPYVGQVLAMQFSWRAPFLLLSLYGIAIAAWILVRLPETSPGRESLRWSRIVGRRQRSCARGNRPDTSSPAARCTERCSPSSSPVSRCWASISPCSASFLLPSAVSLSAPC